MFNLDEAIVEWRRQMQAGGIESPESLDELESHLREDVSRRLRAGGGIPAAFAEATQQLGQVTVLKTEFDKVGGPMNSLLGKTRRSFLMLAGIPEPVPAGVTATFQPAWATYLKGAAAVLPALCFWMATLVFVLPKVREVCVRSGAATLPTSDTPLLFSVAFFVNDLMIFLSAHWPTIAVAVVGLFGLMEWRFRQWPRYRRAVVGMAAFVLNGAVLLSILMILITAVIAAAQLLANGK